MIMSIGAEKAPSKIQPPPEPLIHNKSESKNKYRILLHIYEI